MTRGELGREDSSRLAALGAAWIGLFLLVDPRGQFPLNDDFQYAETARGLVLGRGMHLPQWALSSTVAHAALGAVATAPWGATNESLRFWELTLGGAGLALVYALARRWRASADAALLAALTTAWCPLYACLSASFHLDATVSVLTLAGVLAFLRGRELRSPAWYALASALAAASGLSRQTGYLSVAGGLAALAWERRLSRREAAALVLPAAAAAAGFAAWFRFVHGPTWAWLSGAYSPRTDPGYWLTPAVWAAVTTRAGKALMMTALFLAPLAALRARGLLRRPSRSQAWALAAVGAAALWLWLKAQGMPLLFNTLTHVGLGAGTLIDADDKPGGWWESPWLWNALALAATLSALALTRAAAEEDRGPADREVRAALAYAASPFLPALLMPAIYDRYLLVFLPVAAAAAAAGRRDDARRARPAFAAAAALGFLTWAGLSDYFAWNRARWAAGLSAVAHGVPAERVENGFDWDGELTLTRNLAELRRRKPDAEIGVWDWQALNRVVLETCFKPVPKVPGWVPVAEFPYRTPLLPGGGAAVRLFADPTAVAPGPDPRKK